MHKSFFNQTILDLRKKKIVFLKSRLACTSWLISNMKEIVCFISQVVKHVALNHGDSLFLMFGQEFTTIVLCNAPCKHPSSTQLLLLLQSVEHYYIRGLEASIPTLLYLNFYLLTLLSQINFLYTRAHIAMFGASYLFMK